MVRKLFRIHLFYVVLLALVILLAGYWYEQPAQTSKQPALKICECAGSDDLSVF
jgi:hypothetical protein